MGNERSVQVEGTKGRRSSRFNITTDQLDQLVETSNRAMLNGQVITGVKIDHGNRSVIYDDITAEEALPTTNPYKN